MVFLVVYQSDNQIEHLIIIPVQNAGNGKLNAACCIPSRPANSTKQPHWHGGRLKCAKAQNLFVKLFITIFLAVMQIIADYRILLQVKKKSDNNSF